MTAKLKPQTNTIFNDIHHTFSSDLEELNILMVDRLESPVPFIKKVASHLIEAGGKRIRPLLTFLSAKMFNYKNGNRHIRMGACIEFIHTATLLHDDVIDNSIKRRGLRSSNDLWGNKTSILVGDFLFSKAFEFMIEDENPFITKALSKAASIIAAGEVLQLNKEKDLSITEEEYFHIIESKTAALFAAACEVGGLIADAPKEDVKNLEEFGYNLGVLFQITDDMLDFGIGNTISGKNTGDDIKDGRITLPIILLLKQSPEYSELVKACFNEQESFDIQFESLKNALIQHKIIDKIDIQIKERIRLCQKSLDQFPNSKEKLFLEEILTYTINRANP
jgi:octaprenyl-diphosphate synthase